MTTSQLLPIKLNKVGNPNFLPLIFVQCRRCNQCPHQPRCNQHRQCRCPHSHYQPAFVQPQFTSQGPSGNPQVPPGPYPGMLFNTQGGQWYPNYPAPIPPLAPQVRLPSSAEVFNFVPQPGQTQTTQQNEASNAHNVYGI